MTAATLPQLIAARDECARIINEYGDVYLPIFMRLDDEVQKRQSREDALARVREIVTRNGTQNGTKNEISGSAF